MRRAVAAGPNRRAVASARVDPAGEPYNEAMLKPIVRMAQNRPVLFAALAGALFGLASTIVGEIAGVLHKNPHSVLQFLLPAASGGYQVSAPRAMQAAVLLLIETAANVIVDALLFAAVVALVVFVRRMVRRPKS